MLLTQIIKSVGSSEMMRDLSAMNYSRSVPASPGVHWSSSPGFGRMEPPTPLPGIFGRFETNYGRGNYAGDGGNFEATPTGKKINFCTHGICTCQ